MTNLIALATILTIAATLFNVASTMTGGAIF